MNKDCKSWPKQVCSLEKKSVRKVSPDTECRKIPVELCGPRGCGFSEGAEECREKVKTVIFDKPEEECTLQPRESCKVVTKLVPHLKNTESCVDVPKEVCTTAHTNPRPVRHPVIRTWCYTVQCPHKCVEAARWGECPQECREYQGDPACCAPICPSKCNSRRGDSQGDSQGGCRSAGVEECGFVPGCCPDTFTQVFGETVAFQEEEGKYDGIIEF